MSFESGDGATDAPDEVGTGVAECVGDDASGGEVVTNRYIGEFFDETVAVRIALARVTFGDVDTPLMVCGVRVLRSLVCGAV